MRVEVLLLAGGKSSRMKQPKHLLTRPNGTRFWSYTVSLLQRVLPQTQEVFISLRDESQASGLFDSNETKCHPLYDSAFYDLHTDLANIGPAAGLITAHFHDSDAYWLVVACDLPLITEETLRQLLEEFEEPVTCFVNDEGFCEPLLAIWSPTALYQLTQNALNGATGPNWTVKKLQGKMLRATNSEWVKGANTPEELKTVMEIINSRSD